MEIRKQPVGHVEPVAGINEYVGVAAPWLHRATRRRRLDQPQRGGADRDHPAACCFGGVDFSRRLRCHFAPFGMHPVGGDIVNLDRQKRACADMQGHFGKADTAHCQCRHQTGIEMQGRGRGGDGTGVAGKQRLVVAAVLCIRRAKRCDIGWQGHRACAVQRQVKGGTGQVELQQNRIFVAPRHRCGKTGGKADHIARRQFAQRFGQGAPATVRNRVQQGDLDPRGGVALCGLAGPGTGQPRRDDAGVVEHQPVTGAQERRQVTDPLVDNGVALRHQQPRRTARGGGAGSNQRLWQGKVEIR